ncbi:proline-rich protein HaeIII subfamily 1-like [Pithys albifrons albifrons]|uniref:proline-rich protein HaeIII subfamily 1-like n=1 Tax=Pithys albifrons albifrons TaxID=3385563 RepID=UPI003A5D0184
MSFPFPPGRLPRPAAPPAPLHKCPGQRGPAGGTNAGPPPPRLNSRPATSPRAGAAPLAPPAGTAAAAAACGEAHGPRPPRARTHLGVSGGGGARARARPMRLRPRVRAAEVPPAKRRSAGGAPPPLRQRDPPGVSRASGRPAPPPPAALPPCRDYRRARDGPRDHLSAICPRSFLPSPRAPRPPAPPPIAERLARPPAPPPRLRPRARGTPGAVVRGAPRAQPGPSAAPQPPGGSRGTDGPRLGRIEGHGPAAPATASARTCWRRGQGVPPQAARSSPTPGGARGARGIHSPEPGQGPPRELRRAASPPCADFAKVCRVSAGRGRPRGT